MNSTANKSIHTLVAEAVRSGDVLQINALFQMRPDCVDDGLLGGWLNYAAHEGNCLVVKYLIDRGFDINEGDKYENVGPLTNACSGGHYEIVKYLLDHGAKIDVSASVRNPLFAIIIESVKQSMNRSWGPSTGEAPQIVRLLLERGLDSTVRYNSKTMKNMDAVAFATMMGAHDLAHIIALWNAGGDETKAEGALEEARQVSHANTKPVPPGEQVAPS
jgi:uncharacterized protein